ncbi:hypothetical protein [Pseudoalteromonas byunsanensis]|uniref:Uncharacterized protein n=1 Tax=Pseudoalteromonas byunsanensis TaxID=327939 RepID=A0A1S1N676_9GAMM|nr:hypothetical protein [Pseudoalteromonas byunsanensis]OHU95172.1 hypothetical protein BIW53_10620 [Pseudoalteromonas byunsanensis]
MNKTALLLTVGLISVGAHADQVIYDTDGGAGRVTYYQNAPIDAMVTHSSSAYNLRIYTPHMTNPTPCQFAAVYDQLNDELITTLSVNNKTLSGTIAKGYETRVKYVEAQCTDEQGKSQTLRHKLAPAPQVSFNSQLKVANWTDSSGFGPGYFQDVNYQALLNIDNGEPDGFCHANTLVGQTPNLLNQRHNMGFYSDVLSAQGAAKYDARSSVLVNEIICKSTGGTTRAVEVWHISEQQQRRKLSVDNF